MTEMAGSKPAANSLRAWQVRALEAWRRDRRGIVEVVTGGGKTRFAIEVIRASWAIRNDLRVLVVVPTVALQDQWVVELQDQLGVEVGTRRTDLARSQVVALVLDSARRAVQDLESPGEWLQIVDECHRIASPENRHALMLGTWGSVGLSATPERQYDDLLELHVVPILGPIILSYGYAEAIRDGVITPFDLVNIEVSLTEKERLEVDQLTQKLARAAARWGQNDERTKFAALRRARYVQQIDSRVAVSVELVTHDPSVPTIVFHESISHADRIADALRSLDVGVGVFHSRTSVEARRRDLHLFKLGAIDTLVCCRALDEGLNVPRASRAIVAASTSSTRQRIQRLGRLVRPHALKATPKVITLWAVQSEAARLVAEADRLEGVSNISWLRAEVT